jgi:hypothetical protein
VAESRYGFPVNPEDINGDLRDEHCQGFLCNGMSVPNPEDETSEPCECGCPHCSDAKGRGAERLDQE